MLRDLRYLFQPLTPVNETNSQNKFDFHPNENPTAAELLRSSLAPLPYPVISLETKRERERERESTWERRNAEELLSLQPAGHRPYCLTGQMWKNAKRGIEKGYSTHCPLSTLRHPSDVIFKEESPHSLRLP